MLPVHSAFRSRSLHGAGRWHHAVQQPSVPDVHPGDITGLRAGVECGRRRNADRVGRNGASAGAHLELRAGTVNAIFNLVNLPTVFMNGASAAQDQICRTVGRRRYGAAIDREFGDRVDDRPDAAFTYVRYEADLSDVAPIDVGITSAKQRKRIRKLDAVDQVDRIGSAATSNVDVGAHFAGFLDRQAD